MQKVVQTLERNAREVQFGSVSVELRIHEGRVVKTIYRVSTTDIERNPKNYEEDNDGGDED